MPLLFAEGSPTTEISDARLRAIVHESLELLEQRRGAKFARAVLVPPDFTRFHSCVSLLVLPAIDACLHGCNARYS